MNKKALKGLIVMHDGCQANLAKAMGLSLSRLNAKINETAGAELTRSEISFIANRYDMNDKDIDFVFFDIKVS